MPTAVDEEEEKGGEGEGEGGGEGGGTEGGGNAPISWMPTAVKNKQTSVFAGSFWCLPVSWSSS